MSIKEHPPLKSSNDTLHVPVLLESTLGLLDPKPGETYLDLTAGYGGHAATIFAVTHNEAGSVLVDRDAFAVQKLGERFSDTKVQIRRSDFFAAARQLVEENRTFAMILVDLGVSSPQLDMGERGFSLKNDGPLDMRMDDRQQQSAMTLVNELSEDELSDIIARHGEEPRAVARRIAEAIVNGRPLTRTTQLAVCIESAFSRGRVRKSRIHPATRTFQALRIAVNQELEQIEWMLPLIPSLLERGGRVAIISFHSLEDRLIKRFFTAQKEAGYEAELTILTKKPLDGATYDVHNPRARSAKLRAAVKK